MTPIRVAVVDDSAFIRKAIVRMLDDEPRLEIVGTAASGEELIERLDEWRPDVVTLDLSMPGMGGLRTLDHLAERGATAVIVLSGHSRRDAPIAIEALHRGAVDFIDKRRYSLVDFQALRGVLIARIMAVARRRSDAPPAGAEPVGRRPSRGRGAAPPAAAPSPAPTAEPPQPVRFELLAMGASTGGPVAIQQVLDDLGGSLAIPAAIVQHMPSGFTAAFADRLNNRLAVSVREALDGELLLPATVYIAPAGHHLVLDRQDHGLRARLSSGPPRSGHRPSVDELFSSAAEVVGARTLAVLMTGMGRDGADGVAELRASGAHVLVQDEASAVVWGMPRAAADLASEVLPLDRIGARIGELLASEATVGGAR